MPTINVEKNNVSIGVALSTIEPTTQSKNIKPTKEEQIVVPDDGVFALSKVTVESIPEEYIVPKGTLDINANGTYDVTDYKNAEVKIASNVKKGLIIHSYDEDGYVTDAEIVGYTTIPNYYLYYSAYAYGTSDVSYAWLAKMEKELVIPDEVVEIGKYSFCNCTNLRINKLPPKLTKIGDYCFSNCKNLEITELPETLVTLGNNCFAGCEKLNISKFPPKLSQLGIGTFSNCTGIKKLVIDHTVYFSSSTCSGCTGLETVIFDGYRLNSQMNTFKGCTNLTKVIFKNIKNFTTLSNNNVFSDTPIANGTGYIYVPDDLVETAKKTYNWTYFAEQIRPLSELEEEV